MVEILFCSGDGLKSVPQTDAAAPSPMVISAPVTFLDLVFFSFQF